MCSDEISLLQDHSLYSSAAEESKKAEKIKAELNKIIEKRLKISLVTPNSALSATEALKLLNGLNTTDSVSMMARMISMKHTIEHEISELDVVETDYYDKLADQAEAVDKFRSTQVALKQAARDAKQAVQNESKAKKALEEAQKRAASTKVNVNDLAKAFTKIQLLEGKATQEVETIAEVVGKRQEKVRKALQRKRRETEIERRKEAGEPIGDLKNISDNEDVKAVAVIAKLRKEERILQKENTRRDDIVTGFLSRAAKLKASAEEMDNAKGRAPPLDKD